MFGDVRRVADLLNIDPSMNSNLFSQQRVLGLDTLCLSIDDWLFPQREAIKMRFEDGDDFSCITRPKNLCSTQILWNQFVSLLLTLLKDLDLHGFPADSLSATGIPTPGPFASEPSLCKLLCQMRAVSVAQILK